MSQPIFKFQLQLFCIAWIIMLFQGCDRNRTVANLPDTALLAQQYFQDDAAWFETNVPFFECSDKQIEEVYYYRWKMYKAHLRNTGRDSFVVTEFINDMGWDRDPYSTINAATMHHIYEGRWLRDDRYMNGYIDYMYHQGGNNRSYSESIADASYARFLVNADTAFLTSRLDSIKQKFEDWYDHYDSSKQLYYIPAMPDATEYTIASIDASGGKDGFEGGEAFRPTINSYMYGNALAIAQVAAMNGDSITKELYTRRAAEIRNNTLRYLWHDSMQHFVDRYKVDNQFVKYWTFIRGRELAGMVPWYFNLPENKHSIAWQQVLDTNRLVGAFGLRTNEPSYEYYFKQFVFFQGQRGSQWNGPSWPFQTSLVLTGMANVLNNYEQNVVNNTDYLRLLRQYTMQHYLPDGSLNLVENYDPNLGGPIVYYYWSNHYNHSSYNNLIITGLCGIRPESGDSLSIHPLIDTSIRYFAMDHIRYHGHRLTVLYDRDGDRYKTGKGLTILVDGKKIMSGATGKTRVLIGKAVKQDILPSPSNHALNIARKPYPKLSVSVNSHPDSLFQLNDGRIWYFPEISNRWTTGAAPAWVEFDFGSPRSISQIRLYLFEDGKRYALPDSVRIEQAAGNDNWLGVNLSEKPRLVGNTVNIIRTQKFLAQKIRLNVYPGRLPSAIVEVECYGNTGAND